ncbi:mCG15902, isoform CRA_a [Mus musculus]|nr:mCG15902, isoform CRA_a [Mus musculus]EDL19964.1 mCG15902, isoform CRA_a [Mus musculus]
MATAGETNKAHIKRLNTKPYHYFNNRQWPRGAESSRLSGHCRQRVSLLRCLEVLTDTCGPWHSDHASSLESPLV